MVRWSLCQLAPTDGLNFGLSCTGGLSTVLGTALLSHKLAAQGLWQPLAASVLDAIWGAMTYFAIKSNHRCVGPTGEGLYLCFYTFVCSHLWPGHCRATLLELQDSRADFGPDVGVSQMKAGLLGRMGWLLLRESCPHVA